jgi:hypothetical protein
MTSKLTTKNILCAIVVIFALYGLIVLIRKIMSDDKDKKWFEQYRYQDEEGMEDAFKQVGSTIMLLINMSINQIDSFMRNVSPQTAKYDKPLFGDLANTLNSKVERALDKYKLITDRLPNINPVLQSEINQKFLEYVNLVKESMKTIDEFIEEESNKKIAKLSDNNTNSYNKDDYNPDRYSSKTFKKNFSEGIICPKEKSWVEDDKWLKGVLQKDNNPLKCTYTPYVVMDN